MWHPISELDNMAWYIWAMLHNEHGGSKAYCFVFRMWHRKSISMCMFYFLYSSNHHCVWRHGLRERNRPWAIPRYLAIIILMSIQMVEHWARGWFLNNWFLPVAFSHECLQCYWSSAQVSPPPSSHSELSCSGVIVWRDTICSTDTQDSVVFIHAQWKMNCHWEAALQKITAYFWWTVVDFWHQNSC